MEALQFGSYRVTRKLGEGAMGAVFAATQEGSNRLVAVKVLPRDLAHRGGFRARFEIEIETLRKLDHPNIVHIHGWGVTPGGTIYYVMEIVDGDNLEKRVGRQPGFTWQQVVDIGSQLCRALKHAHDRGIIHRDVKPANIMMTRDGQVKLSDFGIARLYGSTGMTLEGGPIGTANYMSPEQTEGKKATERSDLYSAGCTLFALLAGRAPFVADSLYELLNMHRNIEPPLLRRLAPEAPPELERIIQTLMKKRPEERIANAAVLLRSLQMVERSQAMLHGEGPPEAGATSVATADPQATQDAAQDAATDADAPPKTAPPTSQPPTTAVLPGSGSGSPGATTPQGAGANPAATAAGSDAGTQDAANAATVVRPAGTRESEPGSGSSGALGAPEGPAAALPENAVGAAPTRVYDVADPELPTVAAPGTSSPRPRSRGPGETTAARPVPRGTLAPSRTAPTVGQFVTAEEANRRDREARCHAELQDRRQQFTQHTLRVAVLLGVVLAVALPSWYFLFYRPTLPDQVYARIKAAAKSPAPDQALVEDERDIRDFLGQFPTDRRAPEVRTYLREMELAKAEGQARAMALVSAGADQPAIKRLYAEAMSHARLEPDIAVARLQDILDLYGTAPVLPGDEDTPRYLELARRGYEKLREQSDQYTRDQLMFLTRRLAAMERARQTNPQEARRVCEAMIRAFSGRRWAELSLQRARGIIASLPAATQPAANAPPQTAPASAP